MSLNSRRVAPGRMGSQRANRIKSL